MQKKNCLQFFKVKLFILFIRKFEATNTDVIGLQA